MNPEKRTELVIKLLAYVLPKPEKSIKVENIKDEKPLVIYLDGKELDI